MRRPPFVPVALIALAATACIRIDFDGPLVRGSGVAATETRDVPDFERVSVGGNLDVVVEVGRPTRVTVAGDDNLVPLVRTEVRGSTLVIEQKKRLRPSDGLTVTVAVPRLERASVSGSGEMTVRGVASEAFRASVSGSGELDAEGDFGDLSANVSGSGEMMMRGTAETVDVGVSGSGEVDLMAVPAREARVSVSGSGDVAVQVREHLVARISGSGDVRYAGDPTVDGRVSGAGRIQRVPLTSRAAPGT